MIVSNPHTHTHTHTHTRHRDAKHINTIHRDAKHRDTRYAKHTCTHTAQAHKAHTHRHTKHTHTHRRHTNEGDCITHTHQCSSEVTDVHRLISGGIGKEGGRLASFLQVEILFASQMQL